MSDELRHCTLCPLHRQRKNVALGRGNPQSRFLIIGEMPGKDEDAQGLAFVGRAGRLLDALLIKAEIPPPATFIMNTVQCVRRSTEDSDKILAPDEISTKTCPWLDRRLREQPPLVVLALGRFAIGWFKGYTWETIEKMYVKEEVKKSFTHVQGFTVVPAYHPAYVMRSGEWAARSLLCGMQQARQAYLRLRG
jgi:DNA polymerase